MPASAEVIMAAQIVTATGRTVAIRRLLLDPAVIVTMCARHQTQH